MTDLFPLWQLPVSLLVRVLQKMTPVSFARLRQTCKAMDEIAEKHRKYIGIILYEIDLFWCADFDYKDEEKEDFLYKSVDQFTVTISPHQELDRIPMTIPEARRKLSGYSFDKVRAISRTGRPALSCMTPAVRSEFMDFMRQQRWSVRAVASGLGGKELLDIVRPKILKMYDDCMADIPKSVKILEIGDLVPGSAKLVNFKDAPSHVEDYLIYPRSAVDDEHFMPALIRKIAMTFYNDEFPVPFVHLKHFNFFEEMLPKIKIPSGDEAAGETLKRYLTGTPFEDNQIVTFHKILDRYPDQPASEPGPLKTANIVLTSRTGKRGLLALEIQAGNYPGIEMSAYFWKNRLEYLEPTVEYTEREDSDIW